MHFESLPTELVTQVFLSLPDINSVFALSAACHRFHQVYRSSKRLPILSSAADAEFGPVTDIIQLVTQNASQKTHITRKVPLSDALIHQIVQVGRVAQRWEEIYLFKKWKSDFAKRRLLTDNERFLIRRAIYRLWLFTKAFHNRYNVRTCRSIPEVMRERSALLHNFPANELAEMLDVHQVMRDTVSNNICPSNGKMRQKFRKRHPDAHPQLPLLNIHLNYPPAPSSFIPESWFHNSPLANLTSKQCQPSRWLDPGAEGWGDEISHYYIVEDMMKLDPQQILHLRDHCALKVQVEAYLKDVVCGGAVEWFGNNGETFSETMAFVMKQRGGDMQEVREAVDDEVMGVVIDEA